MQSLPSRERGLKFPQKIRPQLYVPVAPLAGAWIEITKILLCKECAMVAPLAGAWIEIDKTKAKLCQYLSLPSRERGLKSLY